ncbi:alpha/beta fold hydrolase [Halosimplex rubrum]|uniref:Alpha/beta fold hydrolase n=1 Tax=Halosimplex rubrum TaxID=869889 RepID=A0A7D5SW77_9EURY|nr:alpha/beta fold hydrolase [Halosimplex rubrum]QLH76391.1 alpha/beta fold hydrolase [Halosimplex rubrum]
MTATDASLLDLPSAESTRHTVNGVDLHVVRAGDPDDELVVLLHGFPDFWYGWRHQIPALVDAGYYVVVPDQRGYNRSEKPRALDAYRMRELSGDVAALIDAEGRDDAHVVGHDWGAAVAWDLALRHPDTVDHLGIINVPHPSVMRRTLKSSPRQLARSWYMFFFQLPVVPEMVLGRGDARGVLDVLEGSANPGAFTDDELAHYRDAWRRQGAIRGAVNWYRALLRRRDDAPRETVDAPTLVVWGDEDAALLPSMAAESVGYCTDGHLKRIPWASHWVHDEEPERVNDALVGHLRDGNGS